MKATWDKLEKNWMRFEVEVEAAEFAKAVDAAFKKLNNQVTVPGFRKGKAPRAIFERNYGKQSLIQEAVETLLPRAYSLAVVQNNIEPIDQPEIENISSDEGQPFTFSGKVQVQPEVTLGKISGFGVTKPEIAVTEEDVNAQLESLRDRLATLVPDEEGTVEKGSHTVIDFEGFLGETPFEGGKAESYPLEVGSGTFIPGFEDQLVGAKVGENVNVNITFPEDYQAEHLRGQNALFKVTVRELKKKELPELNDAFAAEVSRHATLEELRKDVEARLGEQAKQNAVRALQNELIEQIVAGAEVEVPEALAHRKEHEMVEEFAQNLEQQGFNMEIWEQVTGKTHADLHKEFHEQAVKRVKTELVMAAVAKHEGLTVSDAELEAEFEQMLAQFPAQKAEITKLRGNDNYRVYLKDQILSRKTLDRIVSLNEAPQA
ncbi:MAG TPA: trigger factor [Symbiobacteriaceae bacterium]|nr:trigger factor [Symbiobacteriaceae bacterium]